MFIDDGLDASLSYMGEACCKVASRDNKSGVPISILLLIFVVLGEKFYGGNGFLADCRLDAVILFP